MGKTSLWAAGIQCTLTIAEDELRILDWQDKSIVRRMSDVDARQSGLWALACRCHGSRKVGSRKAATRKAATRKAGSRKARSRGCHRCASPRFSEQLLASCLDGAITFARGLLWRLIIHDLDAIAAVADDAGLLQRVSQN